MGAIITSEAPALRCLGVLGEQGPSPFSAARSVAAGAPHTQVSERVLDWAVGAAGHDQRNRGCHGGGVGVRPSRHSGGRWAQPAAVG
jgi:hypothetical protein